MAWFGMSHKLDKVVGRAKMLKIPASATVAPNDSDTHATYPIIVATGKHFHVRIFNCSSGLI